MGIWRLFVYDQPMSLRRFIVEFFALDLILAVFITLAMALFLKTHG